VTHLGKYCRLNQADIAAAKNRDPHSDSP
jgi:hypothetical protein